jgi:hypothetical protein
MQVVMMASTRRRCVLGWTTPVIEKAIAEYRVMAGCRAGGGEGGSILLAEVAVERVQDNRPGTK